LGSVEVLQSLVHVPSSTKSRIITAAIEKILQRYGRTNHFTHSSEFNPEHFIGRSPMSPLNDSFCSIELLKDRVVVWIVENGISSRVFEHHLSCISVATTDLAIPNLYCYVINLDALKRAKVPKQDRRLFLFECTDLLQTRKLIDETRKRFKNSGCSPRGHHLVTKVRLTPPRPESAPIRRVESDPPQRTQNFVNIDSKNPPLIPPRIHRQSSLRSSRRQAPIGPPIAPKPPGLTELRPEKAQNLPRYLNPH